MLPNATETRIVVTGNYRAWRHFIAVRATEPADVEIRDLAIACLRQLQHIAPNVFGDFVISTARRRHRGRSEPVCHRGLTTAVRSRTSRDDGTDDGANLTNTRGRKGRRTG